MWKKALKSTTPSFIIYDTVVVADSLPHLQNMMDLMDGQYGLNINVTKAKVVVFSKLVPWRAILQINNQVVEQVPSVKYLGALVNENSDPKKGNQIKDRTGQKDIHFHEELPH